MSVINVQAYQFSVIQYNILLHLALNRNVTKQRLLNFLHDDECRAVSPDCMNEHVIGLEGLGLMQTNEDAIGLTDKGMALIKSHILEMLKQDAA